VSQLAEETCDGCELVAEGFDRAGCALYGGNEFLDLEDALERYADETDDGEGICHDGSFRYDPFDARDSIVGLPWGFLLKGWFETLQWLATEYGFSQMYPATTSQP